MLGLEAPPPCAVCKNKQPLGRRCQGRGRVRRGCAIGRPPGFKPARRAGIGRGGAKRAPVIVRAPAAAGAAAAVGAPGRRLGGGGGSAGARAGAAETMVRAAAGWPGSGGGRRRYLLRRPGAAPPAVAPARSEGSGP